MSVEAIITMLVVQVTVTVITARFLWRVLKSKDRRHHSVEHNE